MKRGGELKRSLHKLELGYLLPVAFIAAYADFKWGTVLGYTFAAIYTVALACLLLIQKRDIAVIRGNIISMILSIILCIIFINGQNNGYFKPFGPTGFMVFLTVVFTILQFVIGKIVARVRWNNDQTT